VNEGNHNTNGKIKIIAEIKENINMKFYVVRSIIYVHEIKPKRATFCSYSVDYVTIQKTHTYKIFGINKYDNQINIRLQSITIKSLNLNLIIYANSEPTCHFIQ
jgi:hypothetical protein